MTKITYDEMLAENLRLIQGSLRDLKKLGECSSKLKRQSVVIAAAKKVSKCWESNVTYQSMVPHEVRKELVDALVPFEEMDD